MKKIALLLVFLLVMQTSVFAGPSGVDAFYGALGATALFMVESCLVAWGVDKYIDMHGGGTNYWGTFWGTFLFPLICSPLIYNVTGVQSNLFSGHTLALYLGVQIGGGYLGNNYLFGGPKKESSSQALPTDNIYLGYTRLSLR